MPEPTYGGLTTTELRALVERATAGPWAWSINKRSRDVRLYAQHSGQLTVMDFVRWGMQAAQPRFRVPPLDLMEEMSECHPHPDAKLIVAAVNALAPLLDAHEALQRRVAELEGDR